MDKQAAKIKAAVERIKDSIPPQVQITAAAKGRTPAEVEAAIAAGIAHVGHNYVQEAAKMIPALGEQPVAWRLIGHLQRNKAA